MERAGVPYVLYGQSCSSPLYLTSSHSPFSFHEVSLVWLLSLPKLTLTHHFPAIPNQSGRLEIAHLDTAPAHSGHSVIVLRNECLNDSVCIEM
jgi:hypothetical protein